VLDLSAQTADPFQSHRTHRSARYKRLAYWFLRPLLDRKTRPHLSIAARGLPRLSRVLPERGFPLETRRAWLNRYAPVAGRTLLVQGTGTGWDTLSWLPFSPQVIVGIDAYAFQAAWHRIAAVGPRFVAGDLTALPLGDRTIDVAASDAVFEHCRDLDAVLRETWRVLRAGGAVYATYGPLWYCFGGDHLSGGDGPHLERGYFHLAEDHDAYRAYVETHTNVGADAQGGARYIELGLFSRLTTAQYLAAFARAGFELVDLILEVSGLAIAFGRRWPERAHMLAGRHGVSLDDLLIKANFVVLRKPASPPFTARTQR